MPPKKKAKESPNPVASLPRAKQSPNWPALTPLIPASDLALVEVVPRQIVTIPNLWTATLCKNYVSFLSSLPLTTTPGKPKKGDAVRVNDRYQIDDPVFAERLWSGTALKSLITGAAEGGSNLTDAQRKELWGGEVIGLNPNIRIYRYSKGQFFDQHCKPSRVKLTHVYRCKQSIQLTIARRRFQHRNRSRLTINSCTNHMDPIIVPHFPGHGMHWWRNSILSGPS